MTPMTYQPALPYVSDGIRAAIKGDATLMALLNATGVYLGNLPASASGSYIVIGTPSESEDALFNTPGSSNAETLHIWAPDPKKVRRIYAELARVLDSSAVVIAGYQLVGASTSYIGDSQDPHDPSKWHGVARFSGRMLKT